MHRRSSVPWLAIVSALALLALNVGIAWKLFSVEYSIHTQNNEATLMAIARGILTHPGDLLWWPCWDAGIPFQNTYMPLVPLVTAGFSRASGLSVPLSFHIVMASLYCLGPVFLYLAGRVMSGRTWESLAAPSGIRSCPPWPS